MDRPFATVAAIDVFGGLTTTGAKAEEPVLEFRLIIHTVEVNVISVPNVEDHVLGVAHERGVAVFEDGSR